MPVTAPSTNRRNRQLSTGRSGTVVRSLSSEQRRGLVISLMGPSFCLAPSWFTFVDDPTRLRNDVVVPGATATLALCVLVAGGALLLDRVGTATTN